MLEGAEKIAVTKMPQVEVKLYATLRRYASGKASAQVSIEPGTTVRHVLAHLGVPTEQTRILFVNSRAAELDQPLQEGDRLGIFPAIGGG